MKKYKVRVKFISTSIYEFHIDAKNDKEAKEKAEAHVEEDYWENGVYEHWGEVVVGENYKITAKILDCKEKVENNAFERRINKTYNELFPNPYVAFNNYMNTK